MPGSAARASATTSWPKWFFTSPATPGSAPCCATPAARGSGSGRRAQLDLEKRDLAGVRIRDRDESRTDLQRSRARWLDAPVALAMRLVTQEPPGRLPN